MNALEEIIRAIKSYLDKKNQCTEHQIINHLVSNDIAPFDQLNIRHSKDLFCAHFLTMHALYHIQNDYLKQQQYCLSIEITKIERLNYTCTEEGLTEHDPLKEYYLDISHYFETSEEDVNQLLNSFWQKYLAQDDKQKALTVFSLANDTDYTAIKKRYRTLAQRHHPDKGGCSKQFAKIAAAKQILDRFYSHTSH